MSLIDFSRDFKRPDLQKETLEGYVIETMDEMKRQRVRIRIPLLHRDLSDEQLPWANSDVGGAQANAGAGVGSVNVPDKYSKVIVRFREDDPHNPFYAQSPASDDVNGENELLEDDYDYPMTVGHVDSHGNKWSTNKATGVVNFTSKAGTSITTDGAGNVSISSPTSINLAASGDVNIAAGGNLNLHASGNTNVVGARTDINSNGASAPSVGGARATPQIESQSGKKDL